MEESNLKEENTTKEEIEANETDAEKADAAETEADEIDAEEAEEAEEADTEVDEIDAKRFAAEKAAAEAEKSAEEADKSAEENSEEKPMTESEFIEAQKEVLKKNIRVWTGVLIYMLVVGLVLCLVIYGFAMLTMFVINLLSVLKTKKFLERVENGEVDVKEIYEYYESIERKGARFFVLNFLLGGGLGVLGTFNELKNLTKPMKVGEEILGDEYKNERIAKDPNAQWHYCIYCKKNRTEAHYYLSKLKDGVICSNCFEPYSTMFPKRAENPALLTSSKIAHCVSAWNQTENYSSKELEERLEYLKKNQEEYADFTPTKVFCDGCLEVDEMNFLFRVVSVKDFDSDRVGKPSGLVHPYRELKGIAYELIYEYETPTDNSSGGWRYTDHNSIVLAIDNPYLKEEVFALKKVPTKFFSNSKKVQTEFAEQTVKELAEFFKKPVLDKRKLHR